MAEDIHGRNHTGFDFRRLISETRREWQNPEKILSQIGISFGMVVADLGSGPGFFTLPIARMVGNKGLVYAVDMNHEATAYLRGTIEADSTIGKVIHIINSDVSKTGIAESSVDVSFFANVLHDIENASAFLAEARKISKKDALLVDVDWRKTDRKNMHGPPDEIRISETKAEEIFENEGFVLLKKINAGPHHYGLVYKNSKKY